jgi:hypothetical protein
MNEILHYVFNRFKADRPVTVEVNEQQYAVKSDGTLGEPVRQLRPQWDAPTFPVSTLLGLAALYTAGVDNVDKSQVAFHIASPTRVELVSFKADEFGRRHVYAIAAHGLDTPFKFNEYYKSPEDFLIAFRASFYFNEEAVKVQQLCSTIGSGEAVAVSDDGMSQEVVVKTGTVTKASVQLPTDGVALIPWRTFREVNPVESRFLLRMKGVKDGLPQIALFEIDAKWQLDTKAAIASWIAGELPSATVIQ